MSVDGRRTFVVLHSVRLVEFKQRRHHLVLQLDERLSALVVDPQCRVLLNSCLSFTDSVEMGDFKAQTGVRVMSAVKQQNDFEC
jgi:hypothetical protein